jgi:Domain of unknown function (DUF4338)
MSVVLKHKGQAITEDDVADIRALMSERATWTRRALSIALCERRGWMQDNGVPRDAACRALLLALHRAGHIELPEPRWACREPWRRLRPRRVEVDREPIEATLRELGPVEVRHVGRTSDEAIVNGLIEEHHYLGYTTPVGEQMKYLITARGRPLGCFVWSSAPRHLGPRDRHIGWSPAARTKNIRLLAWVRLFCRGDIGQAARAIEACSG